MGPGSWTATRAAKECKHVLPKVKLCNFLGLLSSSTSLRVSLSHLLKNIVLGSSSPTNLIDKRQREIVLMATREQHDDGSNLLLNRIHELYGEFRVPGASNLKAMGSLSQIEYLSMVQYLLGSEPTLQSSNGQGDGLVSLQSGS